MLFRYVALIENVFYFLFYLCSSYEAFLQFTVSIFLFILFINGCTEVGDSNVVTILAVTECPAPFVEQFFS